MVLGRDGGCSWNGSVVGRIGVCLGWWMMGGWSFRSLMEDLGRVLLGGSGFVVIFLGEIIKMVSGEMSVCS